MQSNAWKKQAYYEKDSHCKQRQKTKITRPPDQELSENKIGTLS